MRKPVPRLSESESKTIDELSRRDFPRCPARQSFWLSFPKAHRPPEAARCNGAAECKKALLLLKVGRLPEDFIEGMACVGGCVGGPSKHKAEMEAKKSRDKLIAEADAREVHENLKAYDMSSFSMHRH